MKIIYIVLLMLLMIPPAADSRVLSFAGDNGAVGGIRLGPERLNRTIALKHLTEAQALWLGIEEAPYTGTLVQHPNENSASQDGKVSLNGGWCSGRTIFKSQAVTFFKTACHCAYGQEIQQVEVGGAIYWVPNVWVTSGCVTNIHQIPTPEDVAILQIIQVSAPPPPRPPCRRCIEKSFIVLNEPFRWRQDPDFEQIVSTGFPSNIENGNKLYRLFCSSLGWLDTGQSTRTCGGDMGPGASGATALCNFGIRSHTNPILANLDCGTVTINVTNGGQVFKVGFAVYGSWMAGLLNHVGIPHQDMTLLDTE